MDTVLAETTAKALADVGYRRVSHKYNMIARIDRPDWLEVLAAHCGRARADFYIMGNPNRNIPGAAPYAVSDKIGNNWKDFYRRVLSKDVMTVTSEVSKLIPGSDYDPVEYIEIVREKSDAGS